MLIKTLFILMETKTLQRCPKKFKKKDKKEMIRVQFHKVLFSCKRHKKKTKEGLGIRK